jgi:hypothetical protein
VTLLGLGRLVFGITFRSIFVCPVPLLHQWDD